MVVRRVLLATLSSGYMGQMPILGRLLLDPDIAGPVLEESCLNPG